MCQAEIKSTDSESNSPLYETIWRHAGSRCSRYWSHDLAVGGKFGGPIWLLQKPLPDTCRPLPCHVCLFRILLELAALAPAPS